MSQRESLLEVVSDESRGSRYRIREGTTTLGRHPDASIFLDFNGVSRNHARIENSRGRLVLIDHASRNGTWVNEERIFAPREIVDGDLVGIGTVMMRLRQSPEASTTGRPLAPSARVNPALLTRPGKVKAENGARLGKIMLIAGLCEVVVLLGNVLVTAFTQWAVQASWLAVPAVGVAVAMFQAVIQEIGKSPSSVPPSSSHAPVRTERNGGRRPLALTLAIALLVVGAGGWAVASGVKYATGWATGNEPGIERLAEPVGLDVGGLSVTVESVRDTEHFTLVGLAIRNTLPDTVNVVLGFGCTLSDPDGNTLDYDPFKSKWNDSIASGTSRRGTVVFEGHLSPSETVATFSISTVMVSGQGRPLSIKVPGLQLRSL